MNLKDILTLVMSALALALSVYVFVDAKQSSSIAEKQAQEKYSHAAFRLGEKQGAFVVQFMQATDGTPEEIQQYRNSLLSQMHLSQSWADILDLRVDLERLFLSFDPESVFTSDLRGPIAERVNAVRGEYIGATYDLAFFAIWLSINIMISEEKDNWDEIYPKVKDALTVLEKRASLAEIDWNIQQSDYSNLTAVKQLAKSLHDQLLEKYSAP